MECLAVALPDKPSLRRFPDVAIKIFPISFAGDPNRVARFTLFTREAHVLAFLNHPNIAAIYGIEQSSCPRRVGSQFGLKPVF